MKSCEKSELLGLKISGLLRFLLFSALMIGCNPSISPSTATLSPAPISPPSPLPTATLPQEDSPTPQVITSTQNNPAIKFNSWEIIHDMVYSPDGLLLAVSAGNHVQFYDTATLEVKMDIPVGAWPIRMAFHPGLPLIALALKDGAIQFRDITTGETICKFIAHEKGVNSLSITPDGEMLITSGTEILSRLWNISSLSNGNCEIQEIGTFIGESFSSPDVTFSPDGKFIALVDLTNIRLRDSTDRKMIALLSGELPIFDIAFSPDGHWLAAAQYLDSVTLWDLTHADHPVAMVLQLPNPDIKAYSWRVAFSPDSKKLAAGASDGSITIWDISDLRTVETYRLPRAVSALAFSPDGKFLAAGGLDASVWLFPLKP